MSQPSNSTMNAALSGLKVVDLTQYEAGTSCTESLGMGEEEIQEYIKETPLKKGTRD